MLLYVISNALNRTRAVDTHFNGNEPIILSKPDIPATTKTTYKLAARYAE